MNSPSQPPPPGGRILEIDALRFIAAFMVVIFHYAFRGYAADNMTDMPYHYLDPFSQYGFLGVTLFFMISGFVILMTANNSGLIKFISSRIIRLYPAFWICCTLTFIVCLLMADERYPVTLKQYLINMTMLSGFLHVPSIDGVYWSLFVELRFYALVAVIVALKKIHHMQGILVAWLILTAIVNFFDLPKLPVLLITTYASHFIGGATFYLIWRDGLSLTRIALLIGSFIETIVLLLAEVPNINEHYHSDLNVALLIGIILSFYIVLFTIAHLKYQLPRKFNYALLGDLTYPLYLIHQNIGLMIFNRLGKMFNVHLVFWGVIALMLIASHLINRCVERPMTKALKYGLQKLTSRMNLQ